MEQLNLHTDRLELRNLRAEDLEHFHRYRSNPEVTRYQGFDVMNREECAEFISKYTHKNFGKPGEWVQYGLIQKETGQLIGDCAIRLREDPRIAEIGITLSHLEQGKGYAIEIGKGLLRFLFDEIGVHRIEEIVDADNRPSIKLLEILGFRQEGHFIENIFFKGKWGSEYQYAMLNREWQASKGQ